jgi:hypothetical protein
MDLLEATSAELKRKVGDVECTFKQLTAYDRAELLRADLLERQAAWKAQRAELVANLKESGIDGEQMFAELETFRERCPYRATEQDWILFCNDPTKELLIFAAALHDAHGAHAEELARKARLSLNDKAELCGLSVGGDKEDPDPNPTAPAYGTPGQNSTGPKPDSESNTTSPKS